MKSTVRWRGVQSPNTGWTWESMSPGRPSRRCGVDDDVRVVLEAPPDRREPPVLDEDRIGVEARLGDVAGDDLAEAGDQRAHGIGAGPRLAEPVLADGVLGLEPADARMRPPAIRNCHRDDDLVRGGRVRDADLHRVEVAAHEHCLDVVDRDVEGGRPSRPASSPRAGSTRRRRRRGPAPRTSGGGSAATCSVSPCSPTIPPLPYASTGLPRAALARSMSSVAEPLARVDEDRDVLGPRPCVRVPDHGRHRDLAQRPVKRPPALLEDLLAERHPLPHVDGHGASPLQGPGCATTDRVSGTAGGETRSVAVAVAPVREAIDARIGNRATIRRVGPPSPSLEELVAHGTRCSPPRAPARPVARPAARRGRRPRRRRVQPHATPSPARASGPRPSRPTAARSRRSSSTTRVGASPTSRSIPRASRWRPRS